MSSSSKVSAGRVSAVYVDDPQGRRLLLANYGPGGMPLLQSLVIATDQGEARAVIGAIAKMLDELPPEPSAAQAER